MKGRVAASSPTTQQIFAVIEQYWGYDSLRPLQEQAIRAGLEYRDSLVVMPTGVVDTGAVMVAVGGVQASPSVSAAITDVAAGTRTMATIPAATVGATRSVTGAPTTGPRVARAGKLCEPPREAASEHCVLRALVLLLVLINVLGRALLIFPACLRSNS